MDADAEILETLDNGFVRVRLPSGITGWQPGAELAARHDAEAAARRRRAAAAAEKLELTRQVAELTRELETLRSQPPDPAEVQRLKAQVHDLTGQNLSLRAALDVLTSRVIELQNGGAESVPDDPELGALVNAGTEFPEPSDGAAMPRDGAVPPGVPGSDAELEELPPGPQAGLLPGLEAEAELELP